MMQSYTVKWPKNKRSLCTTISTSTQRWTPFTGVCWSHYEANTKLKCKSQSSFSMILECSLQKEWGKQDRKRHVRLLPNYCCTKLSLYVYEISLSNNIIIIFTFYFKQKGKKKTPDNISIITWHNRNLKQEYNGPKFRPSLNPGINFFCTEDRTWYDQSEDTYVQMLPPSHNLLPWLTIDSGDISAEVSSCSIKGLV